MNRAVPQPARMDFAARCLANDLVALVDEVKNFFAHKIGNRFVAADVGRLK